MTVPELKEVCRELGLCVGGTKKELLARLLPAPPASVPSLPEADLDENTSNEAWELIATFDLAQNNGIVLDKDVEDSLGHGTGLAQGESVIYICSKIILNHLMVGRSCNARRYWVK